VITIAYIGNFECPFSTENEIRYALEEKLGQRVVKLQENKVVTDEVVTAARERGARLLLWTHTHNWEMVGRISQEKMLAELRSTGLKTASVHL